jgi:hypothetical protein
MPDVLVAVFAPNDQNLDGIADVIAKAQEGRQRLAYDRMPLLVVPLPSRFDSRAEFEESQSWLKKIDQRLGKLYHDWLPRSIRATEVLELTKIPYVPFFSYGEKLPVLTHGTTDPEGIGYYYDIVAGLLASDFKNVESLFSGGQSRVGADDWKTVIRRRDRYQKGVEAEPDVYVSYSHGAFGGDGESDLKVWSQKFAHDLRAELAGTLEFQGVSFFLDESSRSDEAAGLLWDQLRSRVTGSAILVILMTPQWLRSKWCRQEFEWWCEQQNPDALGVGGRVFVCRVLPTDEAGWPMPLQGVGGYFCYDRDRDPGEARPFGWRGSQSDRDDYIDLLVDLAGDMMRHLREIKAALEERQQREAAAARLAADTGQVLYLHARVAHAEAWQRVGDALMTRGFVIVPSEPDPVARDLLGVREIAERRVEMLTGCDGLLLLATEDGRALDADLVTVGRQARYSARARTERLLPCAVLDIAGAAIGSPKRKAAAHALGIDWIDATREVWPDELRGWLSEAEAAPRAPVPPW